MSHQAIYRKFRPMDFESVLGQKHITETIKRQIMKDSVAHAYLFNGIRGTGKTSTAKIFSRAVNCLNPKEGNPCNECEICVSTLKERNMDVVEMDAASNNSVEDIRDLREKVKFLPSKSKFKVYIIDEVHMLSKGAFNALLKTLEEPPEHLLFILATTEPEKIPATILSRCQRFDFKRLSVDDIIINMKDICKQLGVEAEEKALRLIANSAEGAMRDALSILDRCLNLQDEIITYESVLDLLGTVNYSLIIDFAENIINKDVTAMMFQLDDILGEGKEITQFLDDLIKQFRNILILNTSTEGYKYISVGEDVVEAIKQQGKNIDDDTVIKYIEELSETLSLCKKALNERVLLETRLIKMIREKPAYNYMHQEDKEKELTKSKKSKIKSSSKNEKKSKDTKTESEIVIEEKISEKNKENEVVKTTPNSGDFNKVLESWDGILNEIKKLRISFHAIIKEAEPYGLKGDTLKFVFHPNYKFH
ncbi:MAG: DNA polymerase III subunit gamma/tau, partial [Bacillota bacterium]|nr:DNA polymerase III subunit gamma/tau [Bacillota bacterium]